MSHIISFEFDNEDTGIIGSITGAKNCSCFRQKLIDYTYNQSQIYNIDKENFDTFNEEIFSDVPDEKLYNSKRSPRENIIIIKEIAKKFVENFDNRDTKNLMFTGGTGLGKTFLSKCIGYLRSWKNCFIPDFRSSYGFGYGL